MFEQLRTQFGQPDDEPQPTAVLDMWVQSVGQPRRATFEVGSMPWCRVSEPLPALFEAPRADVGGVFRNGVRDSLISQVGLGDLMKFVGRTTENQ
ncbi:hypothetical protein [Lentzea aerocolonigenes]|uniref:hypothetical protein n=1 Tax=Lentzea aerocolonigenes TaxID=68170 RepID=UPI0005ECC49A|nr:hypothetical protein [Lentzea aerocolonigenes]